MRPVPSIFLRTGPSTTFARNEMVGEARPAVNLDQELGQIDLRQPGFDHLAQPPLVRGLGGIDDEVAIGELCLCRRCRPRPD